MCSWLAMLQLFVCPRPLSDSERSVGNEVAMESQDKRNPTCETSHSSPWGRDDQRARPVHCNRIGDVRVSCGSDSFQACPVFWLLYQTPPWSPGGSELQDHLWFCSNGASEGRRVDKGQEVIDTAHLKSHTLILVVVLHLFVNVCQHFCNHLNTKQSCFSSLQLFDGLFLCHVEASTHFTLASMFTFETVGPQFTAGSSAYRSVKYDFRLECRIVQTVKPFDLYYSFSTRGQFDQTSVVYDSD